MVWSSEGLQRNECLGLPVEGQSLEQRSLDRGRGSPARSDDCVSSRRWRRVRATTTADTGRVAEGWREPTGGIGLLKASSTRVTQDPVIVWKQTYQIIQLFCTNQQRIPHLQFVLFLSTQIYNVCDGNGVQGLCSTDFAQLDWARVTRGWISTSFRTEYEVP